MYLYTKYTSLYIYIYHKNTFIFVFRYVDDNHEITIAIEIEKYSHQRLMYFIAIAKNAYSI